MAQSWAIRAERPEDAVSVASLDDNGFGPGRFAKSAYRLREGVAPEASLCFVAEGEKDLLGSVRFWPILVGVKRALLLGPLAVHASMRGQGIGLALMSRGIEAARATDYAAILLIGDEAYYARAGFAPLAPGSVRFPGPVDPLRILGLALKPGALAGEIRRARLDDPVCADGAAAGWLTPLLPAPAPAPAAGGVVE